MAMMVPTVLDAKGTKILAKSLFKELRGNGYSANQILSLSTELIDLVTQDLREANTQAEQANDAQLQA
jgi:DNA-binding ferritin-like protein